MVKKRRVVSSKKGPKKVKVPSLTLEQLLVEGDDAFEALDYARASSLFQTASTILQGQLDKEPSISAVLSKVLGKLGETKVSMGEQEAAREHFAHAISLLNDHHEEDVTVEHMTNKSSLYMYLGQLSSDEEALQAYNTGVELLEICIRIPGNTAKGDVEDLTIESDQNECNTVDELRKQLCGAYCSIAELYMTDLCYIDNAEALCEESVLKAMKVIDPLDGKPVVDALQTLASLRISQSRGVEAIELILEAYLKMKSGCEALAALVGLSENENNGEEVEAPVELVEVEAANALPGFEFRCQTARILLECASICKEEENKVEKANHCANSAIQVLGSLLAENDDVIEVWYLVGCAFEALTPANNDDAVSYFEQALEMLINVRESFNKNESERVEDINKQIVDVQSKLKHLGFDPEDADSVMDTA